MSVIIEKETEFTVDFDLEKLVCQIADRCLEYEKCPYEAWVSVTFTDNEGIREINKEHRNIDNATDVLSFPMVTYEMPGNFSHLEEPLNKNRHFNLDTGELLLGDIAISVERAREQAEEYGHSLERELAFLMAHSVLHLMGYDHMEEKEREQMEEKQEQILQKLGITRD